MWINEFNDLNHLKRFLVDNLIYDEKFGFSFCHIFCGMELSKAPTILGKPNFVSLKRETQQIIKYYGMINHPKKGKNKYNKLLLLLWTSNRKPIKIIKIHTAYFNTGEFAQAYLLFVKELIVSLIEKFGTPKKKSLRKGRELVVYKLGHHILSLWNNHEGLRIELTFNK